MSHSLAQIPNGDSPEKKNLPEISEGSFIILSPHHYHQKNKIQLSDNYC